MWLAFFGLEGGCAEVAVADAFGFVFGVDGVLGGGFAVVAA